MNAINYTYRFIALFLALLMFVTSVGFTVDMHYCNGELKSFSLIGKAKSCHEKAKAPCPHHKKMMADNQGDAIDTKSCCNNKMLHFQSDQDKQVQNFDIKVSPPLQQFITAFVTAFFTDGFTQNDRPTFVHYKPPLIKRDIPVLTQSFLL